MRIAVTNKMNKWFIDSFFNVETLYFSTPSEILDGLKKHKPDVFVFGDYKNSFNDFEIDELKYIITYNKINTLFYGGWQGFGLGNYKSAFFDDDTSLSFRDDELQMLIYKISATQENDIFTFSFDDCPEIAFYNKVDISTEDYRVILKWKDDISSYPLLLSRVSNNRKQLLLLTTFTPPGGAKRLVLWNKYPTIWKEMLEWLGSDRLTYNKTENNILVSLLSNYWSEQLTYEFAKKVLATEMYSFMEELLLLMRDMYDRLGDWKMSSIIGEKYYQYNKKIHGDTIHTLKSFAELKKIQAYYNIVENNYRKASDCFKDGSRVWRDIEKNSQSVVVAKGFVFYYSGLSSLYHAFEYLNSSLQEDKKSTGTIHLLKIAEKDTKTAAYLFKNAVDLNGHAYSNVMLKLCRLVEIVLMHKIDKANPIKSFLKDVFFLSNYKRAIIELQLLLKDYSESIKFEHPPFTIDLDLIDNQDYKWYFKVELISLEHYTILNTISQILRDELIKFKKNISKKQRKRFTEDVNIDTLIDCVVNKKNDEGEKSVQNTYIIYGGLTIKGIKADQVNLIKSFSKEGVPLSKKEIDLIQNNLIIMSECEDQEMALSAKDEIFGFVEEKLKTKPIQVKNDIINKLKDFMMDIEKINAEQVNVIGEGKDVNIKLEKKTSPKKTNYWSSGLLVIVFYLLVLFSMVLFEWLGISLYWFPLVIIGAILIFTVSGAFSLRDSEKLSQKNFLELMSIVFKKLIGVGLFSKNKDNEKESDEKVQ